MLSPYVWNYPHIAIILISGRYGKFPPACIYRFAVYFLRLPFSFFDGLLSLMSICHDKEGQLRLHVTWKSSSPLAKLNSHLTWLKLITGKPGTCVVNHNCTRHVTIDNNLFIDICSIFNGKGLLEFETGKCMHFI